MIVLTLYYVNSSCFISHFTFTFVSFIFIYVRIETVPSQLSSLLVTTTTTVIVIAITPEMHPYQHNHYKDY